MKFDILSIQEKSTVVQFEVSSIKSLKNLDIHRFGVRRFENGKMFQTSRLGEANEDLLIADTKKWGGPGVPHEYGFAPPHCEVRTGVDVDISYTAQFEDSARTLAAKFPEFVFSGKCSVAHVSTALKSNYGLDLKASGGVCEWEIFYQRKGSGNMFDGFIADYTSKPNIQHDLEVHSEFLNAQKYEAKLTPGKIPVLFADAMAPLKKLSESLAINRYHEGSCLYAGKLGESLFSPLVTLVDYAYLPELGINQFFDGEGVVRSKDDYALIENGRFLGLISDLRFGKKFCEPSTGNGIRSFDTGVGLSPRILGFSKGSQPWREAIKQLDRCLLAVVAAGGDSNDLGEFSTPVQVGYIFEKGLLVGRSPQVTVKASLTDYLGKDLIAVTSDSPTPSSPSASVISEMNVLLN